MTIKAKLRLSYFLMIVVSLMLSWSALSSMLKSHDVASYVHTTLVDRYSRTRRTGDLISQIEAQMEKISLGADSRPIVPVIDDLSKQLQLAVDEMQESRYPTEVGAVKQSTRLYLESLNKRVFPALWISIAYFSTVLPGFSLSIISSIPIMAFIGVLIS